MFRQRPELARAYAQLVRAPHGLGYYRQLLAGVGWTSLPWLHQLRQPTLILAGNDDPIVPAVNARAMAHLIPRARLHIITGGHCCSSLSESKWLRSCISSSGRSEFMKLTLVKWQESTSGEKKQEQGYVTTG